jgi:hypothetical protein
MYLSGVSDAFKLTVPIIFALDHITSVEFAALELHRDDVTGGLVE